MQILLLKMEIIDYLHLQFVILEKMKLFMTQLVFLLGGYKLATLPNRVYQASVLMHSDNTGMRFASLRNFAYIGNAICNRRLTQGGIQYGKTIECLKKYIELIETDIFSAHKKYIFNQMILYAKDGITNEDKVVGWAF